MTTATNKVFIGLQHENCYLVGWIRTWWGHFSWWWRNEKFLASGEGHAPPSSFPVGKTLKDEEAFLNCICCLNFV